jgi:hypothetical protein
MVAKALYECRDPFHGMKYNDICKYIETNYPVKTEYRRFVRLALATAVKDGAFVQLGPRNYKLTTEERNRMKGGKTKRRSATKASAEKKKVTKKRSSAKKESDEKKKSPKKRTTKNSKKEGDDKKKSKKRSSEKEVTKSKKRKSVGKVDDEDESPRKKSKKSSKSEKSGKSEKSSSGDNTLIWYWQYFHEGWCNYDPQASEVVEATYQEYLRNPGITDVRSVESGEWNYMVDFRQMTQQNVRHEAHTVRRIRRVQIPKKDAIYRKKFPGTENDKTL